MAAFDLRKALLRNNPIHFEADFRPREATTMYGNPVLPAYLAKLAVPSLRETIDVGEAVIESAQPGVNRIYTWTMDKNAKQSERLQLAFFVACAGIQPAGEAPAVLYSGDEEEENLGLANMKDRVSAERNIWTSLFELGIVEVNTGNDLPDLYRFKRNL